MRENQVESSRGKVAKAILEISRRPGLYQGRFSTELFLYELQPVKRRGIPSRIADRPRRQQGNAKSGSATRALARRSACAETD
jgi:hypothetical protein